MSGGPFRFPWAVRILFAGTVLATALPTVCGAQWQWPVPSEGLESAEILNDRISPWWNVSGTPEGDNSTRRTYRFMAPGTVLYHDTETSPRMGAYTVPRTGDLVVMQHENGFWTFYAGESLRLPESSWSAGHKIDSNTSFSAEGRVSFAVFDATRQVFVNARAILPEQDSVPGDGLPVVAFMQNGVLTLSRDLNAGEANFVVPEQWLEPAELPRRMYILVDGLLQAEIDFTLPGETVQRMTPDGDLLLLPMIMEPGPILVEVESHQFDGTVERRTIPIRVPEP